MVLTQFLQIGIDVATVIAAVRYNVKAHKRTLAAETDRVILAKQALESEREKFEAEKVSFLADQAKFLTSEIREHRGRLDQSDLKSDQLQRQMHSLEGKVDATGSVFTEVLQRAKRNQPSAATMEDAKPDLYDRTKATVKKESPK